MFCHSMLMSARFLRYANPLVTAISFFWSRCNSLKRHYESHCSSVARLSKELSCAQFDIIFIWVFSNKGPWLSCGQAYFFRTLEIMDEDFCIH